MDMADFISEWHVAQKIRRDKLRVQQINWASSAHYLEDFSATWENSLVHHHPGINPDFIQVRNVRNASSLHDLALIPSGFIGFSPDHNAIPSQTDGVPAYQDYTAMFTNMPQPMPSSTVIAPIIDISDPQGCGNWKNVLDPSQQVNCDYWRIMNYGSDQAHASNCLKPNYNAGQDAARSSMSNPSSSEISTQEDSQKCHVNSFYQNNHQNLVGLACSGTCNSTGETYRGSWSGNSNGDRDSTKQGLSLSLSSNPMPKACISLSRILKPSIISISSGKSLHDVVGVSSVNIQRNVSPLGPFTGYATILKSSKFLKPAQELLDEFCISRISKITNKSMTSADVGNMTEEGGGPNGNHDARVLSSTLKGCKKIDGSDSSEPFKPENREKKAKLLFMLEEVCRRYKLYQQQMQMEISCFESVAGLSTATPYISLTLKRIAGNFQCLKNGISDQLKHISKSLGDKFLSPSSSKSEGGNNYMPNAKYMEGHNNNNSLQKQKSFDGNVGFLEPQQHVCRPQRGLPERAVAVLRAWLFDHFLHPYPTDTDKQMLATQTGLSPNQVSNWFINARVRVWKPMVEEIHMLETKGLVVGTQASQNPNRRSNIGTSPPNIENITSRPYTNLNQQETNKKQTVESSGTSSLMAMGNKFSNEYKAENWNIQEKRTRVDYMSNSDGSPLKGFVPDDERSGFERGMGNVSLTLGLRQRGKCAAAAAVSRIRGWVRRWSDGS